MHAVTFVTMSRERRRAAGRCVREEIAMEPLFEHRMQFAGVDTRVLELEGRGDPFVLFHGWSDSADTWRHVLALLARHERRAIAVDLPGFGTAGAAQDGALLPQLDAFGAEALAYAAADIRPARGRDRARPSARP